MSAPRKRTKLRRQHDNSLRGQAMREGGIRELLRVRRIWKRLVMEGALSGPWPKLGLIDDALRAEADRLRKLGGGSRE